MSTLNILIVDDRHESRVLLHRAFLRAGVTVELAIASNGMDALGWLNRSDTPRPDAILTDLLMPQLDGFGLLRCLSRDQDLSSIPVIVITGSEDPTHHVRLAISHARAWARKPESIADFAHIIETILALCRAPAEPTKEHLRLSSPGPAPGRFQSPSGYEPDLS